MVLWATDICLICFCLDGDNCTALLPRFNEYRNKVTKMRIVDVWKQDDKILAYCTGSSITREFCCKEISVNGKELSIARVDILTSVSGVVNAVLQINTQDMASVPLGEFEIIC